VIGVFATAEQIDLNANNVLSIPDGVTAGNSQTFGYDALFHALRRAV
jgi:hypothetical protein